MDKMSQVPTLCWKCQTISGVQLVMNDITLKAVHHQEHAKELIEQFEMGRLGRVKDTYELVTATVPSPDQEPQQP